MVMQQAGEWRELSKVVVGFPWLLLLTFTCGQPRGAGLDWEARDSAAKRLGGWLETAKASSRHLRYSRVAFTGRRVQCRMFMKSRPWSDFPCRIKNQERSLGQGKLEGLWMSVVMSARGTPEDGGR